MYTEDGVSFSYFRFQGEVPKNLFVVNDQYDAAVALHWVENYLLNSTGTKS